MQPTNGLKFNRQPSKKVFFYCQPSKRQININRKKVSRHFKECDFFSRSARFSGFPTDHLTSRNRKRALKKSSWRPANGDAVEKFQNSFGALLRMPQCWGCIVAVCIASVNGWDSQWQIDTKLSRINGVFSNFPNIRSKGQLPMIMFSFDEQKTTLQIQEQIHNAPKCYWKLTKMQKSLLNLTYAQMFVFSRECIFFAYCISQASEGVPIFFLRKTSL